MVVGSSLDNGSFLFLYFYFIFSATSLVEIIQNSHLSFQPRENFVCLFVCSFNLFVLFFPTPKALGRYVLVKEHNVLHNRHDRSSARFRIRQPTYTLAYTLIKVQISE